MLEMSAGCEYALKASCGLFHIAHILFTDIPPVSPRKIHSFWSPRKRIRFPFGTAAKPSSIKVEVKRKHFSAGRNFSCFAAHLIEQDLF